MQVKYNFSYFYSLHVNSAIKKELIKNNTYEIFSYDINTMIFKRKSRNQSFILF